MPDTLGIIMLICLGLIGLVACGIGVHEAGVARGMRWVYDQLDSDTRYRVDNCVQRNQVRLQNKRQTKRSAE